MMASSCGYVAEVTSSSTEMPYLRGFSATKPNGILRILLLLVIVSGKASLRLAKACCCYSAVRWMKIMALALLGFE